MCVQPVCKGVAECVCVRVCDHANNVWQNKGIPTCAVLGFFFFMDGHNDDRTLCDLCVDGELL